MDQWRKKRPSDQIVRSAGLLLGRVVDERKWQLVCSNSVTLMQSLAELCPIIFSLTTHDSSIMVTTERLVDRLRVRDIEEVKQADDIAWQATFAGLMTWVNVTQVHETGDRYHSRFADILTRRKYTTKFPAIFFAAYMPVLGRSFDEDSVKMIFSKIANALGDTAAVVIEEDIVVQYFEAEVTPSQVTSIKI